MTRRRTTLTLASISLLGLLQPASAQMMPNDNEGWGSRCSQFLDTGTIPAPDMSGITPVRFEELARDRASRNQHLVACNLYLSAAAAQGALGQTQASKTDLILATLERKAALGQKLSFSEKIVRGSASLVAASKAAAPPNSQEAGAILMLLNPGAMPMGQGGMPVGQGPMAMPAAQGLPGQVGMMPMPPADPGAVGMPMPPPPGQVPSQGMQGQYAAVSMPLPVPAPSPSSMPNMSESTASGQPWAPQTAATTGAPGARNGRYTPLSGDDNLSSDRARHDYVFSHPTGMGTPAICQGDWSRMGSSLAPCQGALHKQADAERAAGAWWDALEDLDNARLAAYTAGNLGLESMNQGDARKDINAHLHLAPSAPKPTAAMSRNVGTPPPGSYGCYSAAAVISMGLSGGPILEQGPNFAGDVWILDAHHYAGPTDKRNQGTFHMQGSVMVVDSGGGYYNKPGSMDTTQLTYIPDGVFHKPTIHVTFYTNGSPVVGLTCEKQDHE